MKRLVLTSGMILTYSSTVSQVHNSFKVTLHTPQARQPHHTANMLNSKDRKDCVAPSILGSFSDLSLPLLSTIISFIDFPTTASVLSRVCKQWRDACHSPLSFRDLRLILNSDTPYGIFAHWPPFFVSVKKLKLTDLDAHS